MSARGKDEHHHKVDVAALADEERHEYKFDKVVKKSTTSHDIHYGSYASRHLPQQNKSWLALFFGSRTIGKQEETLHPCKIVARDFHSCMDRNEDDYDFCRSKANLFEGCLREYKIY